MSNPLQGNRIWTKRRMGPESDNSMIRALTDARLLVTNRDGDEATVEVAHEALMREWDRLADWISEVQGREIAYG